MINYIKLCMIVFWGFLLQKNSLSQTINDNYIFINKYDTIVEIKQGSFQCIKIELIKKQEGANCDLLLWADLKGNTPSVRNYSPLVTDYSYSEPDSLIYMVIFHQEAFTFWKIKPDGSTNTEYKAAIKAGYEENVEYIRQNTLKVEEQIIRLSDYLKLKDVKLSIVGSKLLTACYTENKKIILFTYSFPNKEWEIIENRKLTEEELKDLSIF